MSTVQAPLADLPAEADRVLAAAGEAQLELRLLGGLAVRHLCPAAAAPPLARPYADLDVIVSSRVPNKAMTELMTGLGYEPHTSFNALRGDRRMYFFDTANDRHVDVFVDLFQMCHTLDFKDRIPLRPDTLPPADLLLTKLQVVELNQKDVLDLLALLHDVPLGEGDPSVIDIEYLARLWSADWPLWRTCGDTLVRLRDAVADVLSEPAADLVEQARTRLLQVHAEGRRTMAWKLRARVGDRIRWYELPEEVD